MLPFPNPIHAQARRRLIKPVTPLFGRQDVLSQLDTLMQDDWIHVSITGPPGVGKTRLVQEWALTSSKAVIACDLSTTHHKEDICLELALGLGFEPTQHATVDGMLLQLVAALKAQPAIILCLDHTDHIQRHVTDILQHLNQNLQTLRCLSTGQRRLGLRNEHVIQLAPLNTEDATSLFVDRAQRVNHRFELNETTQPQLTKLVKHLDGLPLAIELAAAHIRMLPPGELLKRLPHRFQLLKPSRFQPIKSAIGLEATFQMAWETLSPSEQRALACCAVFCGPFSIGAAESIIPWDDAKHDGLWLLGMLETLCDYSMIQAEESVYFPGEIRLRLLESLRAFVLQNHPPDDLALLRNNHSAHYIEQGQQWCQFAQKDTSARWPDRLIEERHHFECILEREDTTMAAQAALVLNMLFETIGASQAHLEMLQKMFRRTTSQAHKDDLLQAMGYLHMSRGALERAIQAFTQITEHSTAHALSTIRCAEVHRLKGAPQTGRTLLETWLTRSQPSETTHRLALAYLAACCADMKDFDEARQHLDTLKKAPTLNLRLECDVLRRMAYTLFFLKAPEKQRVHLIQLRQLADKLNDRRWALLATQSLADVACILGDYAESIDAFRQVIDAHQRSGLDGALSHAWSNLGAAQHRAGDVDGAKHSYETAILMHRQQGNQAYLAIALHAMAVLHHEQKDWISAERFYALSIEQFKHDPDNLGANLLCRAWCRLAQGRQSDACADLEQASTCFKPDTAWFAAIKMAQPKPEPRSIELAKRHTKSTETSANINHVLSCLLAIHEPTNQHEKQLRADMQATHSLYGRLVVKQFEIDQKAQPQPKAAPVDMLNVGPQGKWFELDGQPRVNLARRKAIRLIFFALLEQMAQNPLDVYTLFDVGWPDQEIDPELAAERVYWAIRTLRQLGLQPYIITTDDGYILKDTLHIQWFEV